MTPPVVMTQEQLMQLLQGLQDQQRAQTPVSDSSPLNGNFAKCSCRFSGSPDSNVNAFVDAVKTYKDCAQVSDENALRGLPILFTEHAATWWLGVKSSITTWDEAVDALSNAFGALKPAYEIYRELFSKEQENGQPTDLFISNARALISQLTEKPSSSMQLDMIYGLLNKKLRKRISREEITSFDSLLKRARDVERILKESETVGHNKPHREEQKDTNTKSVSHIRNRIRCSHCKNYGHEKEACRKLRNPTSVEQLKCYGCGSPGVIKSRCPNCNNNTKTPSTVAEFHASAAAASGAVEQETRPTIVVHILGSRGEVMIDTGAKQSIASRELHNLLVQKGCSFTEEMMTIVLADGSRNNEVVRKTRVPVILEGKTVVTNFISLARNSENRTLLGVDFIKNANISLNLPLGKWNFNDNPSKYYQFQTYTTETTTDVLSMTCLRPEEGSTLSQSEKATLATLLTKHKEVFTPNTAPTIYAEHRIDTGDHAPIAMPPYRLPEMKKNVLKAELDEMMRNDVIQPCESPWAAPVVMVPKRDGSIRVCQDYRRLNSITTTDSYPLPRIDDLLHQAKRTPYMSTIDLRAGYYQVPVREQDRDKTAFVTPFGTYRFKRMPFGLKNAPATFQRLIDRFRAGLTDTVTIFAYLDDMIVLSETFDKHILDLEAVFERLCLFGLKANRGKCVFVRASVKFLGHEITAAGIQTDKDKVSAIVSLPPPRNLKHLLSFVQTCSWYRRFIPDFAKIAKPLTDLTRKQATWTWETVQQQAYETLKNLLTSSPVLRQADSSLPYVLKTDASDYALGACLLQGENEDERPVEYASRLLTDAEKNYSVTEREALAVVWGVTKFREYLECARVTVCTDHQALRWLMSLKTPTGRLARWALTLQAYDLEIKYTPGRQNVVADQLSRPPCKDASEQNVCPVCTVAVDVPKRSATDIRKMQQQDPEIKKIMDAFENATDPSGFTTWTGRGYIMSNGVLYRYNPEIEEDDAQLVLPESERKRVLREYHDDATAGHYGVDGTYRRIARRYFWPGMYHTINNYVKRCPDCQRYKVTNLKPAGLLQTPVMAQRFQTLAIDLFGPLPVTTKGEKWIFIITDVCTKWVEIFPLVEATALECAKTLIAEVFFRFGTPRKLISDNGSQFTSAVMQKVAHCLGIKQSLVPVYHPAANPVERRNRDLKTQLSILVANEHGKWSDQLAAVRFAMNTNRCDSTGHSAAFVTFGSELRTPDDVQRDLRAIVESDNFVGEITPYLTKTAKILREVRETYENKQDSRKAASDARKREAPRYAIGDRVLIATHPLSNRAKGYTGKFAPRRDGPYRIMNWCSPTSYMVSTLLSPDVSIGTYHTSQLTPYREDNDALGTAQPVLEKRRRGRPRKPRHSNDVDPQPSGVSDQRGSL